MVHSRRLMRLRKSNIFDLLTILEIQILLLIIDGKISRTINQLKIQEN